MDCGAVFSKYLLFVFNFVFFLSGIAVLTVGSYIKANEQDYVGLIGTNLFAVCILLIVIGILVTIIGFFGCCGAIRESKCMLYTYSGLLCLIFVMEFAGGIAAFVYREDISKNTSNNLKSSMKNYFTDDSIKKQWDNMQKDLSCCGADKPQDWFNVTTFTNPDNVPSSCCLPGVDCKPDTHGLVPYDDKTKYKNGCVPQINAQINHYAVIIGGVAIGIAFIQILGIVFACCLASAIKD
jgi:CD63 antigen